MNKVGISIIAMRDERVVNGEIRTAPTRVGAVVRLDNYLLSVNFR